MNEIQMQEWEREEQRRYHKQDRNHAKLVRAKRADRRAKHATDLYTHTVNTTTNQNRNR